MLLPIAFGVLFAPLAQTDVVVSPQGLDTNPGTPARPVASLEEARDIARRNQIHRIVLRDGRYRLRDSFELDGRDSGLTLLAAPGAHPLLVGGIDIPVAAIQDCKDPAVLNRIIDPLARRVVKEVDLKALGIQHLDPIQDRGFPHSPSASPEELFFFSRPGTLARWPNYGYAKVGKVIDPGNGENDQDKPKRKPMFDGGDRAKKWAQAEDPWLYGYWFFDWADESIHASAINAETGAITLAHPHVYGVAANTPFYAENLIEELDQPGEYVIDRTRSKLFFINRTDRSDAPQLFISTLAKPLISITKSANITISGLDLCLSRGDGALVRDCENARFEGCRFYSLGARAAVFERGHRSGLMSCNIAHMGEGGVALSGGDRKNLEPAKLFVTNCDIGDYQRRSQTYRPAVIIAGVGNVVSHCSIHDAPHSAIIYGGNNHVIEFNEFFNTISLTGDGGVVYCGRDWTARGTAIQYNYFHDNVGQRKWEPAIYVDDQGSGIKMVGNLIERCHWGFLIGGGRENVIERNVLIDCDLAMQCDARGLGWAAKGKQTMLNNLNAVPYQSPIWRSSYPALANILNEDPMAPRGNRIIRNLLIRSGKVDQQMEAPYRKTVQMEGNVETKTNTDFTKVLPIPKSRMGIYTDAIRANLKPIGR